MGTENTGRHRTRWPIYYLAMTPISVYSFLRATLGGIHADDDCICITGVNDRIKYGRRAWDKFGTTAQMLARLAEWRRWNNNQRSIYYSVCTFAPETTRRKKENVVSTSTIWADYDALTPAVEAYLREQGYGSIPAPSILVNTSAGNWQALWQLSAVTTEIERVLSVVRRLAAATGGDTVVHDQGRVLRLPDFKNVKQGRACYQVKAYRVHGNRITLDALEAAIPVPAEPEQKPKCRRAEKLTTEGLHAPACEAKQASAISFSSDGCQLLQAADRWTHNQWLSVGRALYRIHGAAGVETWLALSAADVRPGQWQGRAAALAELDAAPHNPWSCPALGCRADTCGGCTGILHFLYAHSHSEVSHDR